MLPILIENLTQEIQKLPGVGKRGAQKMALDILQHSSDNFENLNSAIHKMRQEVFFCQNCGFFADNAGPVHQELNNFASPFAANQSNNHNSNSKSSTASSKDSSYNNYLQEAIPVSTQKLCQICQNSHRNPFQICLVEKPTDILNIEKSQIYQGFYHVLNKLISPLDKVFVENTSLPDLFERRLPFLLEVITKLSTGLESPSKFSNFESIELSSSKNVEFDSEAATNKSDSPFQSKAQVSQSAKKNKPQIELILFFKTGFSGEATTAYLREKIHQEGWQNDILITKLAEGLPLYYNPDNLDQATMIKALEDRKSLW